VEPDACTLLMKALTTAIMVLVSLHCPGQNKAGMNPEIFAPGVISTDAHEFSCTLSPDGRNFYFTRRVPEIDRNRIMVASRKEDAWNEPVILPELEEFESMEPYITSDGASIYFQSWKPFEGNKEPSMDIWRMDKLDNGWSDPIHMDHPFNPGKAMYISMPDNQTIYTTDISQGFQPTRIVYSVWFEGRYRDFQSVGEKINATGTEKYPCIAPDESFLIFVRSTPEISDLYVSFRQNDSSWGEPEKVELGLSRVSMPSISPDGESLFFSSMGERNKGDIYRVSINVITDLEYYRTIPNSLIEVSGKYSSRELPEEVSGSDTP